jgi:hypothetical protein
MSNNTQLTSADGYDTKRMVFGDFIPGSIPNSTPAINYKRIPISTLNPDGTTGDLVLPTSELFSFGVSENKDPTTQKVNGHVLPLCLWSRDGATPEEETWTNAFNAIVEKCKDHVIENREELEQYELTRNDLKKFNPLYWKKEKGKIVEGRGPTLYAKLIEVKPKRTKGKHHEGEEKENKPKILSMFFDEQDESLDPLTLLGKYCFVKGAIKIESIFIGSKISLQVKVYEATVRLMASGMPRLMKRPKAAGRLMNAKSNPMAEVKRSQDVESDGESDDDNIDAGSIHSDSEEEEPASPPPKPKKKSPAKKRVVRKVRRVKKAST